MQERLSNIAILGKYERGQTNEINIEIITNFTNAKKARKKVYFNLYSKIIIEK